MDPAGLSMENFDAIGRWRTRTEAGSDGRCVGRASRRVRRSRRGRSAAGAAATAGVVRLDADREAADVRVSAAASSTTMRPRSARSFADARAQDYRFSSLVLGIVKSDSVSDEDVAMIHHQDGTATPHVSARDGRGAGAAAARRDGSGADRVAQTAANPVRRLGFVYIPMGMNAAAWTPGDEGRLTELSPSLRPLDAVLDQLTVVTNLELQERVHHRQPCLGQLRISELRQGQANRRHRLSSWARRSIRSPRRASARTRRFLRSSSAPIYRAGRQLRQRLRVRVPEQPVVVVADDAAADRSRSARGVRAAVRRRRQARNGGAPSCGRAAASSTG